MDKIERILSSVGLPELCHRLGLPGNITPNRAIRSPLRTDNKPSFCARVNGCWKWRDYGNGKHGNVIDFYAEATGSTNPINDLYELWFGNGQHDPPAMIKPHEEPLREAVPLDWNERVSKLTDDMLKELSEWRGYDIEFCHWIRKKKIIGSYAGTFCFPVINDGHVVRFHVRWPSGAWQYKPHGVSSRLTPLVVGPAKAYMRCAFESQWDMLAVMSVLPREFIADCQWIATRGKGNGYAGDVDYVFRQRDDTEDKRADEERWASRWAEARSVWTPRGVKDMNDWLREDRDRMSKKLVEWFC